MNTTEHINNEMPLNEVTQNEEGAVDLQSHDVWEALVDIELEKLKAAFPDESEMKLLDLAVEKAKTIDPGTYERAMKELSESESAA